MKYESALNRITETLRSTGTGCHSAIWAAANIGIEAGETPDRVIADIRSVAQGVRRTVPDSEIKTAVEKVARVCVPMTAGEHRKPAPPPPKPPFDGIAYRKRLIAAGDGALECDFMELSGGTLPPEPADDAVYLLQCLYRPQDVLFVGDIHDWKVDTVQRITERFKRGCAIPPHIIPNPMTGKQGMTKDGKPSFRCDATVSQYRFAVVEFDDLDRASQLAFWHSIITKKLLDVAALIDSGKKSIHGWLTVNCKDADEWAAVVRTGMYATPHGRMRLLGVDSSCQNESRLSRMPSHQREGGRMQQLVYLSPKHQEANQ